MKINFYDILLWIFFLFAVFIALWYLFGNSPTLEQALLLFIIGFMFKLQSNFISNKTELKFLNIRFNRLENSFVRLANDFKNHIYDNKLHKKR